MSDGPTTRERILDAALDLAARKGADATSMRELAEACGINVAALYYHFDSKETLLRAVIEERHYDLMMGLVPVPPRGSGTDRERLTALLALLWEGILSEDRVWRVLLAESCHHNEAAEEVASDLVGRFEEAAAHWLAEDFDHLAVPVTVGARLMADFLFSNIARVAIGAVTTSEVADHAAALATVICASSDGPRA